jgi:hypothetical protein
MSRAASRIVRPAPLTRKTARSGAFRGGLIESHPAAGVARAPVVPLSDVRIRRTAACSVRRESGATFFRPDDSGSRSEMSSCRHLAVVRSPITRPQLSERPFPRRRPRLPRAYADDARLPSRGSPSASQASTAMRANLHSFPNRRPGRSAHHNPNASGYRTAPRTPSSAPGTSSRAMNASAGKE